MAIDQSILKPYLAANAGVTSDAAGVTAAQGAHQVAKPISLPDCCAQCALDAATQGRMQAHPHFDRILDEFNGQDRAALLTWLPGLVALSDLTSQQEAAVATYLQTVGTETDPAWANLTADDITAARAALAVDATNQMALQDSNTGYQSIVAAIDAAKRAGVAVVWSDLVARFQAAGA